MVFSEELLVEKFISESVVVDPFTPISKAVGLMREKNAYEIFTCIGDKIGTVTVRDILRAKSLAGIKVESLLNFVPKIPADANLLQAAKIMSEYRLRSLPIVKKNEIIGKIDIKAIVINVKDSALGNIRASKIMTSTPTTISVGEKSSKAREIMLRRKFDHLPVVRDKRLIGIITSTQIVFNLMADLGSEKYTMGVPSTINPFDYPVEAVMSTHTLRCYPQSSIGEVAKSMLEQDLSYCLVTIDDEIHGIITYRDFASLISAERDRIEAPIYIIGLPEDPFEAEAAKIKFIRLIKSLNRFLPPIMEAKSIIKSSSPDKQRRRYEVTVNIRTSKRSYNYSSEGWDLPIIYDEISKAVKKMAAQRREIKRKKRGIFSSE
ncbi:CBS domain-containing protein [Candidatus Bathyarchaeota archaeon]|nr:CBS domain-containing protein [Candidatus Bathyarchaeota archaeon]